MKRFWKTASFKAVDHSFAITLDGRPVKTPAKRALLVPSKVMASQMVKEWDAQQETVDPTTMPWTRSANAAIDKVADQRDEVCEHLKGYAETDLLCYRADGPEALQNRQSSTWDPLLAWVRDEFEADMVVTTGLMPVTQEPTAVQNLVRPLQSMSEFALTGFYDLVTLSGSFILALAVTQGKQSEDAIWAASRIDELWQIEQWGEDEEASKMAENKKIALFHAGSFFRAA